MSTIYVLVDPRTDQVRYVGRTTDLLLRLAQHCQTVRSLRPSRKELWIEELRQEGLKPLIREVESVCRRDQGANSTGSLTLWERDAIC